MSRCGADDTCPCGRGASYAACCARWHRGEAAPDAGALMRSRYCAYVRGDEAYLLATWHASTRPAALDLHAAPAPTWLGLDVRRETAGADPDRAEVEFVARHRIGGRRAARLHEISRFVREDGRWYYFDGSILPS
jgi:SEC-C motif-containing protein